MADLVFTTRGTAQVIAEQEKLAQALGKQKTGAKQLTAEYAANEAELKKLGRTAQQIYLANETAQEKYNRKLAETKAALQGNVNQVELLKRAEIQLKLEYLRSTDANVKLASQRKQSAAAAADEARKVAAEQKALAAESAKAGNAVAAAFSPTKLATYALGFVGINKIASAITEEFRAQQGMIDKKNATQLSVGESRNVLLRNMIGSPKAEITGALAASQQISGETGVSEVEINNALANAVSATGNVPLSIELVRKAAGFLQDRPSEIGDYAGSLGDLTRVTGSKDPNTALGLLAIIGRYSRPVSPRQTSESLAPAMLGTLPFGGDARTSGALFASLTTGSGDTSGLHSATGTVSLAQQLQEAALGKGSFAGSSNRPGFAPGELGGNTLMERIRFLQSHPETAQKFLDFASFERKVVGPITQLLTDPKSQMRGDFDTVANAIGNNASLAAEGRAAPDILNYNTLNSVSNRKRELSRTLEGLQTRRASDRLSTEELEALRGIALESGSSNLGATFGEYAGRVRGGGTVTATEAISQLNSRASELENPYISLSPVSEGDTGSFMEREATPEEKESAKLLRQAVEKLQQSVDEQKETNRTLRRQQPGLRVGGS